MELGSCVQFCEIGYRRTDTSCFLFDSDRFFRQSPVVSWKMKPPEKKPLVRREIPEEAQVKIRKGQKKQHINPVQELSIFKEKDSF